MASVLKVNEIQHTGGTSALTIDSNGIVGRSVIPAFHAYGISNGTYTTTGTVPFNNTLLNNGNHYDTSTYTFTAPVSGIYNISIMGLFNTSTYIRLYKNDGSDTDYMQLHASSSSGWGEASGTAIIQLAATNTVRMVLTAGGIYLGGTNSTDCLNAFSGYLIG